MPRADELLDVAWVVMSAILVLANNNLISEQWNKEKWKLKISGLIQSMTKTFVAAHNQHRHRPANSFLPKFFTDFLESSQGETLIGLETSNYHQQPHLDMIQFCLTHQEAEKGGVIYHTSSL